MGLTPLRLDEARTLDRIVASDPKWVPLLDHGYTTDGRRYVVTPLRRSSLADQLEHGPTPWYPATKLIADAAEAVAEAHAAGYSFGYLRPSGILIDGSADARVVAYGMSTRRFDDGTAQFMAPELTGDGSPIPPSDVFSLALILASLLAGRPIDHSESSCDVIDGLSDLAPDRILEIIDYGLSGFRNRYADAGTLARALETARRDQNHPGRRIRANASRREAGDPLSVLPAETLIVVAAGRARDGVASTGTGAVSIPDPLDRRHLDETPTAVPFDAPVIEIDDPTDPGIAARHRDQLEGSADDHQRRAADNR